MLKGNIHVSGFKGFWYLVDTYIFQGQKCYELEHEEFGNDVAHIIVDENGKILHSEVWNGLLDLEERYGKENIIY